ncbi:methyltransferase domain-containing protein [Megalodesulfovibrio gigas]|uniref:Putative type 12 methyltransferase n=1 Tax=Megalodesulfovibrio gigas (strain ATCC 19364 / DSM 1382 / NCIMB 9332 / VKM B-1759) TaxID=1121448 RepID=T2GAH5_MEGG1|nr:type 12 methyltransferase [Megalodesulfovibrio gigas]AGW13179.1 putative type 12 methyltransferase [Megalodesulfovibrio gigas DSM 1382 = ATCC 19364]
MDTRSSTTSDGWTLNCGSGKSFKPDCLNVDINPFWQPDIVADLARPFPPTPETVYSSSRFGAVRLAPGCAARIIAHDLLEHLPQVTTFYETCLRLLAEGGLLDVVVPYDLAHGAWQDPTHVRAFNENSWLYVTDWHWYLGWTEARFELVSLEYRYSQLGQRLLDKGKDAEMIRRRPRAVDAMAVLLRKRSLTDKERGKVATRWAKYLDRPADFTPSQAG